MAIASLSYDPATDREMYPGTIPMNAAAKSAADAFAISPVNLPVSLFPLDQGTYSSHVGSPCCETCESRSEHDTDVPDVYWHIDPSEEIPD